MNFFQSIGDSSGAVDTLGLSAYVANNFSLAIAVVVALVATALVLMAVRRERGGGFGAALTHFGFGMLSIMVGFLAPILPFWPAGPASGIASLQGVAFMVGYILMLLGAHKLTSVVSPQK